MALKDYHKRVETTNLLDHLPLRIRQTRKAYLGRYASCAALLLGGIGTAVAVHPLALVASIVGIVLVIKPELRVRTHSIEIHENKVTSNHGTFTRHAYSIYYDDIMDNKIGQTFWQRLLDYGSVYVNNPSHSHHGFYQHNIPHPKKIRKLIEAMEHNFAITRHEKKPLSAMQEKPKHP